MNDHLKQLAVVVVIAALMVLAAAGMFLDGVAH